MTLALNGNRDCGFLYLNRDNRWLDFHWRGLEQLAEGALQLCSLPLFEGELPPELSTANDPAGPAGLAIDIDGTIYFSDSSGTRLLMIDGCDGSIVRVACVGGMGRAPVQFNVCRGLLIPAHRRSLFVADSLNHRVQVFDIASCQLVEVLNQLGPSDEPGTSPGTNRLHTPWGLAGDNHGNVYVVDYESRSVQKFDRAGEVVADFASNVHASNALIRPAGIAAYSHQDKVRLYVIDEATHSIVVLTGEGRPVRDSDGHQISFGFTKLRKPMGIAVSKDAVYVGDNELRRVLKYKRSGDYQFIGEAVGYKGPVAALALDNAGNLLVHPGVADLVPVKMAIERGFRTQGVLWSEAITTGPKIAWHRLQAITAGLAVGAHLRLFVHTSNDAADQPLIEPESAEPFADPKWVPALKSSDIHDLFIGGAPAQFLWVGALFLGDGRVTPVMPQMRVEFDHQSYTSELPAIYRAESPSGEFLLRFLSLVETFFDELEGNIGSLSRLFDPNAVPRDFLPWLATWLAFDLDENWDEQKQRAAVAHAFEMYGRRGTVQGLRESLRLFAGVRAIITEPILGAAWWSLPTGASACNCGQTKTSKEESWTKTENSVLGVTTMLAAAQPQGAVVGTSATLDHSHLITNEEFGAPLFEGVAHQFSVQLYRSQLKCSETLTNLRAIIEREKPAHTDYHLCIIEPRMRVGFQGRVGIDTIIAGPPTHTRLGDETEIDHELVMGGEPAGRIGENNRVGMTTRVG